MSGNVKQILVANSAGSKMKTLFSAHLEAGKGIVGDRYYSTQGTFSDKLLDVPDFEITLIEQEQINTFNSITELHYTGRDFRRNIVSKGIDLNQLVDQEFSIGHVTFRGIKLCEPCAYLSERLGPEIMQHMVHKAGLRAQILNDGKIKLNDAIKPVKPF